MRKLAATVAVLLSLGAALAVPAGEASGLRELPANRWTKRDDGGSGAREGAAVFWMPGSRRFLVAGGMQAVSAKGHTPYEIQTYDPVTGVWENQFPAGKEGWGDKSGASKAPAHPGPSGATAYVRFTDAEGNLRLEPPTLLAGCAAFDIVGSQLFVLLSAHLFDGDLSGKKLPLLRYDVAARKWEMLASDWPGDEAQVQAQGRSLVGGALVFDPVNKELLLLCGLCPAAERGEIGSWAFSLADKQWRKMAGESAGLAPLRAKCLAALDAARNAMGMARADFHSGRSARRGAGEEAKDATGNLDKAVELLKELKAALPVAAIEKHETGARERAAALLAAAEQGLGVAKKTLDGGGIDADMLKALHQASWSLDEAADCLRSAPGERTEVAAAYHPSTQSIVIFGGSHGDYVCADTWVYDCRRKSWRQVWSDQGPSPRTAASLVWLPKDGRLALLGGVTVNSKFTYYNPWRQPDDGRSWLFDPATGKWSAVNEPKSDETSPVMASPVAAGAEDVLLGLSLERQESAGQGHWKFLSGTWLKRIDASGADADGKSERPAQRTYRSAAINVYNPTWFDAAPPGSPKEVEAWIAGLKPNTWEPVPAAPRLPAQRAWGIQVYNPDDDCVYFRSGGHMADQSTAQAIYHLGTNRWSIPFDAEVMFGPGGGKGMTFSGRPYVPNHIYHQACYDPAAKRAVYPSPGGTGLFDHRRMDFDRRVVQPFVHSSYYTKTVGTPQGAVVWTASPNNYFGILDHKTHSWKPLPVTGKLPAHIQGDCNSMTYDPKRDCIWLGATQSFSSGPVYLSRYDMKTGSVEAVKARGEENLKWMSRFRDTTYVPKLDLIVSAVFAPNGRQVAYDPAANRWVSLGLTQPEQWSQKGNVADTTPFYDARRDLLWMASAKRHIWALKIDAKTLSVSEDFGRRDP